jgi:hypothetical protein
LLRRTHLRRILLHDAVIVDTMLAAQLAPELGAHLRDPSTAMSQDEVCEHYH